MGATDSGSATASIKYSTTRFGEIEVLPSDVLTFPEGLLGFNQYHRFVLLKDPEQHPFLWLQALEEPDLAFVVIDPFLFFPGYEIQVKSHELSTIQLEDLRKATVLTIVTVPDDPMNLTTNLRGPLVINSEKNVVKQLVLIDDRYHTKHYLLKEIPPELATPPGEAPSNAGSEVPRKEREPSS